MPLLHIVNANFEWELAQDTPISLQQAIEQHPVLLQLQFLPLLYAGPQDGIAVTAVPADSFKCPQPLHLLSGSDTLPYDQIESWGATKSLQSWAETQRIPLRQPPLEVVRHVNSKAFSFDAGPKLPGAELLYTEEDVLRWSISTKGPKVLKTCFGFSGKGHLHLPCAPETLSRFVQKEFQRKRPVIGEPWVRRVFDFSTQWFITPGGQISYLGETICVNSPRGQYQETRVGNVFGRYASFLEKHLDSAFPILQHMAAEGYFGNVGIDAMIYENDRLQPIVEINARKTMGYVALKLQQTRFPKQTIALSYRTTSDCINLLPKSVVKTNGSLVKFAKQLVINLHSR